MEPTELRRLINKYENGTLTKEESEKLEKWFQDLNFEHPAPLSEKLQKGSADELYLKFTERLKKHEDAKIRKLNPKIWAAASILVIVSIGFLLYQYKLKNNLPDKLTTIDNSLLIDPAPVIGKTVLKLANGHQLVLGKERKGMISYVDSISQPNLSSSIITSTGSQFRVVLSDGTVVWLNASSSLTFPVSFHSQNSRSVTLKGEAYFEVAKNKHQPFFVNVVSTSKSGSDARVKVLGTHFNIKAYADETEIKTTLIEGAVELSNKTNRAFLKPGQQGIINSALNQIDLKNVDAQSAMAWKNGDFVFVKEDIHSVMRQIARWYDLEIIYKGDFGGMEFTGTISKYENAAKVLDLLAQTETIKFKLEGRRVTLMP